MLLKLIKKAHIKMITSPTGLLSILTILMPVVFIVVGIVLQIDINKNIETTELNPYYGYLWIGLGVFFILFSYRKFTEFFKLFKYIFKPEEYQVVKNMISDGIDINIYNEELSRFNCIDKLNKNFPIYYTDNFVMGYTGYSFFIMLKEDIIWAYEYNGNGIVFLDKHKFYGFTFFPKVDTNDEVMELFKKEMPYIYFGTDFDFERIMHKEFDHTLELIKEEKIKYLDNPTTYLEEKERAEKERIEAEALKLEEEKKAEIERIEALEENKNKDIFDEKE